MSSAVGECSKRHFQKADKIVPTAELDNIWKANYMNLAKHRPCFAKNICLDFQILPC